MYVINNCFKDHKVYFNVKHIVSSILKCPLTSVSVNEVLDESKKWEEARPYKNIPGPKPLPIPFYGNAWRFFAFGSYGKLDSMKWQALLRAQYGDIVRLTGLGKKDFILLYDPTYIEKMHRNESVWPIRDSLECLVYYQDRIRPDVYKHTKGLPILQGKKWHEVRTAINPTMLHPKRVKTYTGPIVSIADVFIERIKLIRDEKSEMPSDFANELNKWSLETITFIVLDTRLGCLANDLDEYSRAQRLITAVRDMFQCFYYLDIMPSIWKYVSTPSWRKFVKTMDYITNFAHQCVNTKMKIIQQQKCNGDNEPKSVLETLLKGKNQNFALIMAMDMMIAGIDTTSNAVATILTFLAANQEKQEKLYCELKRFLPNKDSLLTADLLNEMKYLKATIKESLRIRPVAPGNSRTTVKDLVIGNYQIPKGTRLISMNNLLCNDEKYFKEADKFIPERWLKSENSSAISASNVNPFLFLPFGFGTRMCIGRRFAELEIEIIISKIIRNFKVFYHYGEMQWSTLILTKPAKPLKFKMETREN